MAFALSDLAVPPGWEPVAELCFRESRRSEAVIEAIVARIHEVIPEYRTQAPVTTQDLRDSVRTNLEMMLVGTAERRGPRAEHLEAARALGVRRADQLSMPVNSVLQAFVVGYQELWNDLLRESSSSSHEVRELLLMAAATVWEWVHEVTNAVGSAYHERVRQRAAMTGARRERLFEALLGGGYDEDELRGVATALGFDPDGRFRAVAAAADSEARVEAVTEALMSEPGRHQAIGRAEKLFMLDQGSTSDSLLSVIHSATPGAAVGVGVGRVGIQGAAVSLGDAERALVLSERLGRPVDFEQDWHAATLAASEHRLACLLEAGAERARTSPDLARTVIAYTENRFSKTRTAQALHLHANTVAYRLSRWGELTGWDLRSRDGLIRSLAALELVRTGSSASADPDPMASASTCGG